MPVVISDTSCLVFLGKIGQLELLHVLFGEVWLTPTVAAEYLLPLPDWVVVQSPAQLPTLAQLPARFGAGERSVFGLALLYPDSLLIMDDEQAKQRAKKAGITCIGTLGILLLAKEAGLLTAVRPSVQQLRTVGGMWLTDEVAEQVCRLADE